MRPIYISKSIYEYTNNDNLNFLRDVNIALGQCAHDVGAPRYGLCNQFTNWDLVVPERYKGPETFDSTNTFSDITDERALELEQLVESSGKPLGIMWSGGIDSTVMIAACIRNFKSLNRLTVFMNNYSYYENSIFFYNVIKKYNLNYTDTGDCTFNVRDKYTIADGVAVASLFGPRLMLEYLKAYPLDDSFISSKNNILAFIGQSINPQFCNRHVDLNRFFDLVQNNINDVQAPVITVHDWFSWISFNFYWAGELINQYSSQTCDKNTRNFSIWRKNSRHWYNTTEYQKWCFSETGKQEKYFTTLSEYKMTAKKYIHSIDKDDSALLYKTKCDSSYQYYIPDRNKNIVIFDDGSGVDNDEPERLQKFIQNYCLV